MRSKPKVADHSTLHITIALNRAKALSITFKSLDPRHLVECYVDTWSRLFVDLNSSAKVGGREAELINIFKQVALGLEPSKALLDTSHALATLFVRLSSGGYFPYGNNITARKFIHDLSEYLVNQGVLPRALDFRLADAELYELSEAEVALEFERMVLSKIIPTPVSDEIEFWPQLPDSSIEVGGFRYLTYDANFLVTLNGGLIQAESAVIALDNIIRKSGNPLGFTVDRFAVEKYLFNGGKPLSTLDGITFGAEVPLMCLDVDYLTGMVMDSKFEELMRMLRRKNIPVLAIPEHEGLGKFIDDGVRARIKRLRNYINILKKRAFKDKKPASGTPNFFLTMGGVGSGKSSLESYVNECTKGNHIAMSMDRARSFSKLYDFYLQCAHHSDDYRALRLFALCIVEEVTEAALLGGYNYFRDALTIPFDKGREELIARFKDCGYQTQILSASAPLFVERDRKDLDKPVHVRILKRYNKKKRAVPWHIVIPKHVAHPLAFLEALRHATVDRFTIFDTMRKKGETKLMSISAWVTQEIFVEIKNAMGISRGVLLSCLISHNIIDEDDLPKEFQLKRLEVLEFGTDSMNGAVRILVVFDLVKFIDFMQKGILYPKARGYDELIFNSHPIHMPAIDYPYDRRHNEPQWRLRNQVAANDTYLL